MDCGVALSKTFLLFLSLIFWAAGAALGYVGYYVIHSYKNFDNFRVDKYAVIPAAFILAVAVVMFIIGLIGCCATVKESKVGLSFFVLIIVVVFAAEITASAFGFIYRRKINGGLDESMKEVFTKYDGKNSESRAVDYLQSQLECCGIQNYTDWLIWFSYNNSVPASCCKVNTTCTGLYSHPELLNTAGCKTKLEDLLQNVLTYAILVILGFAIIKLLGMICACLIICRSPRNEYQPLYS